MVLVACMPKWKRKCHDTSCLCAYETLLHPRCRCVLPRVKKARCSSRFPQCLVFTSALTAALLLGVSSSHPLEPSREPWAGLQQSCTRWNITVHRDEPSAAQQPSTGDRRRLWSVYVRGGGLGLFLALHLRWALLSTSTHGDRAHALQHWSPRYFKRSGIVLQSAPHCAFKHFNKSLLVRFNKANARCTESITLFCKSFGQWLDVSGQFKRSLI